MVFIDHIKFHNPLECVENQYTYKYRRSNALKIPKVSIEGISIMLSVLKLYILTYISIKQKICKM